MDFEQDKYQEHKGVVERYNWMGWLFTIVGCFIVALLVLMFLDMNNYTNFNSQPPESAPAVQIDAPAISNFTASPSE